MTTPLVSVCVITYQHEKYIRQCLESMVTQDTNFPFEIVIGDDGSTDGTGEICIEYQQKYPDLVKLTIHDRTQNRDEYTGCPGTYNFMQALAQAKGKYIALCEGDDYWLDASKLQQQVDFLEQHPDFTICFHAVYVDAGNGLEKDNITAVAKETSTLTDLVAGNFIHTPSVVYRNVFPERFPDFFYSAPVLDYLLHLYAAEKGKIKFIAKKMAAYRVHQESYWSSTNPQKRSLMWLDVLEPLIKHFEHNEHLILILKQQLFNLGTLLIDDLYQHQKQDELTQVINQLTRVDVFESIRRLSDKEFQEQNQVLNQSLRAHKLMGGSLINIVKFVIKNIFTGLNQKDTQNVYCKVANKILDELNLLETKQKQISLTCKYGESSEVVASLRKILQKDQKQQEIRDLLNCFTELEETYQYRQWLAGHALLEIDGQIFAERMMRQWQSQPVFHLILFLYPGENHLLADTIDSLAKQMYKGWRLSVIAGEPCPDSVFEEFDALQWVQVSQDVNPYEVLNKLIVDVDADWVSVIEPGASFEPHTLIRFGDYINLEKDQHFFYADEDTLTADGLRKKPKFKPDFNLDLLRSNFYTGGFSVINRNVLLELGGFQATPNVENYDLAFKVFEKFGADTICHIADILYHAPEQSQRTQDSKITHIVVENHLIRSGVSAEVMEGYLPGTQRVQYHHPNVPKISIIIPTKDKQEYFQSCIESLLNKTEYSNFEVLVVNNQSKDPDILQYFEDLPGLYNGRVSILEYDEEFNFSAISNLAARHATGEYLLFLNNDTEIIQAQWLNRMVSYAQRPEVGVVGARLVLPEHGQLQHVGIVLGLDIVADHPYNGMLDIHTPGYMGRALMDQNYSAVTGACLLIRSEIYQAVGGMDEVDFPISYNDIDLCLKVKKAGYQVVWTPYATLVHHLSVSQISELDPELVAKRNTKFLFSKDRMFFKWREIIANDPAYNRNLSLRVRDFSVDASLPCNWDVNFHDKPRVLGLPLPGGAGDYRIIMPFEALSQSGMSQCEYIRLQGNKSRHLSSSEIERLAPDSLVIHSAINDVELRYLEDLKKFNKDLFVVFSLDDLITQIPEKSTAYSTYMRNYRDVKPRLRKALSFCDRLVVSTEPLAELCADMIEDIHIVSNRLNRNIWCDLKSLRKQSEKPRVGWAGAQQHQGDLEIIFDVVKETADEIDWVFMGMCPEDIEPYVKENHSFVAIDEYPEKLASLNLDLAIAPLEECQFNDAKSNLRLLEYGILAWPVICSDVFPYRSFDAPVVRVKNEKQQWISAIRGCLSDLDSNYEAGDRLRNWVLEKFILEDYLGDWYKAFIR